MRCRWLWRTASPAADGAALRCAPAPDCSTKLRPAPAIGAAGADIRGLTVLKSEGGRGFDEVTVAVPGSDPTDLVQVLGSIGGVEVIEIKPIN